MDPQGTRRGSAEHTLGNAASKKYNDDEKRDNVRITWISNKYYIF
jgi:hypothetical protein